MNDIRMTRKKLQEVGKDRIIRDKLVILEGYGEINQLYQKDMEELHELVTDKRIRDKLIILEDMEELHKVATRELRNK